MKKKQQHSVIIELPVAFTEEGNRIIEHHRHMKIQTRALTNNQRIAAVWLSEGAKEKGLTYKTMSGRKSECSVISDVCRYILEIVYDEIDRQTKQECNTTN